jgi:hypothetical protein
MRKLLILALTAVAVLTAPAVRAAEPTVELRIKAIKDLLPLAEYLGDLAGQGEQAEQGAKFVEAMAGKKGVIEGIDITKPIGFYASMTPAVIDSPMVVLVPVGDEKAFLNLLTGKLNLAPEKGEGDIYTLNVPNVPPKVYFKFHKGYVCVTVHNKAALEGDAILDPKDFFAKPESAILALSVHLDRIPAEVRKTVLGQLELKLADEKAKPAKTPAESKAKALTLDATYDGIAAILSDGKSISLKLDIDPKTDDIGLSLVFGGKPSTEVTKLLASYAGRKAVAPMAAAKDAVLSLAVNVQVPDGMKKKYGELVDLLIAEGLENAKGNDRDAAKKVFDALEPSLKSGVLELGAALTATADGKHEVLSAVRVVSGKGIEALLKEFAPFIPEGQAKVKFDVDKVGAANVHEIVPPANAVPENIFGASSLWLSTADDLLVVGFGAKSDAVKKLAAAPAGSSPIVEFETSVARLLPIVEPQTKPEVFKVLNQEVFADGKPAGKDTIKLGITGGEELKVQFTIKGRAAKFLALLQKRKSES